MRSPKIKNTYIRIRLDDDEKNGIEEAASLSGLTVSAWLRMVARMEAEKSLAKAGKKAPWEG